MVAHQVLDLLHLERHAHADADRSHRQQLDHSLHPHRPARTDPLQRRQPHHLRPVKEELPRAALAGIHHELRHRLPQQLPHRLPRHLVCHVKRVDIHHLAGITPDLRRRSLPLRDLSMVHGSNHTRYEDTPPSAQSPRPAECPKRGQRRRALPARLPPAISLSSPRVIGSGPLALKLANEAESADDTSSQG